MEINPDDNKAPAVGDVSKISLTDNEFSIPFVCGGDLLSRMLWTIVDARYDDSKCYRILLQLSPMDFMGRKLV